MKLGMNGDLWTAKSEKHRKPGYLDNRCHGDQKTFSQLKYSLLINQNLLGRSGMGLEKNTQNIRFHGYRSVAMATKKGFWGQNRVVFTEYHDNGLVSMESNALSSFLHSPPDFLSSLVTVDP